MSVLYVTHFWISGCVKYLQLSGFANISASVNILYTSPMYEDHSRIYTRNGIAGLKKYTFSNLTHIAKDFLM